MLVLARYVDQTRDWPRQGRHILAQYDEESVVVYQAYKSSIAQWAIRREQIDDERPERTKVFFVPSPPLYTL